MFGFSTWGDSAEQTDQGGDPWANKRTFEDYDRLVRKGLPDDERARLAEAWVNLRYANGHFDDADAARGGASAGTDTVQGYRSDSWDPFSGVGSATPMEYDKADFRIYPPIAQWIAGKLSENLYKRSPTRNLTDKAVGDVVASVYSSNGMAAQWQEADRLAIIGGFAAFQFSGGDNPSSPVDIQLWGADQLCVWTRPDNPKIPDAVVTLDKVDGRTRAQLWTREIVATYTTRRGATRGNETRQFDPIDQKPNPYRDEEGNGVLPFAFVHHIAPAVEFTTDSPGTNFRELNRYILHGLDDTADGVRYLSKPIGLAEGVSVDWVAPATVRPGMFLKLPASGVDAAGNGPAPTLRYLSADLQWVAVVWAHLRQYLELTLALAGIPKNSLFMEFDAQSGISILVNLSPLLSWTEQRRRPFSDYEKEAVRTLLLVLGSHAQANGLDPARIYAAARDPGLSLRWPRLYVDLPGPERDRADGVRLTWGLASLLDLVMEREDCTEIEALELLQRVKAGNDQLRSLGIEPVPAVLLPKPQPSFGGFGQPQGLEGGADQLDQVTDQTGGDQGPGITGEPVDAQTRADSVSGEGG